MRAMVDLLQSAAGRGFLESKGMYVDPGTFIQMLEPPIRPGLVEHLGLAADARPVYVGQQVQPDYQASVTSKFRAARDVGAVSAAVPVGLWLDTDRAGSHKGQTTITWTGPGGVVRTARLAPRRWKDLEVRFVPVSDHDLDSVMAEMARWVGELPRRDRTRAEERRAAIAEALQAERPRTLAQANRAIASLLLDRSLSFAPVSVFVSDLARPGLVSDAVAKALEHLGDFVAVFNEAIQTMTAQDVDPVVKPLGDDYLPLHHSCPEDGVRRRLVHERHGSDHFAVSACPCGREYRFHLGSGAASLGELAETDRWSPDVTLPVYMNGLASGMVVGRSSGLYGLVLNEVVERVLGERPIPGVLPPDLGEAVQGARHPDSLLFDYIAGP